MSRDDREAIVESEVEDREKEKGDLKIDVEKKVERKFSLARYLDKRST